MILSCFRCSDNTGAGAKFQDKKYGDGKRVHNECAKSGTGPVQHRCTICKTERGAKAAL
jgi:hypothetical protein